MRKLGTGFDKRVVDNRSLSGIICLGDSNTQNGWFCLPSDTLGGTGSVSQPGERWASKVATRLGVKVTNYGWSGRTAASFLPAITPPTPGHILLQGRGPQGWLNVKAKYTIIKLGLNDDSYFTTAQFKANLLLLCNTVISSGGIPMLMTNVAVDYPTHYSTDRNVTIDSYDDQMRDLSDENGFHLIDFNAVSKYEITQGNWDQRVRANQTTFDNALDGPPPPAPWNVESPPSSGFYPSWYTDIHLNQYGTTLAADAVEDYFIDNGLTF